jgi:hypothetical protein
MSEDAARRRAERAERFGAQRDSQRRRREQESTKAQVLVDQFVARATEAGLATVELTARPWSGRGRYRTGVVGWYLRSDRSIGVGTDGAYYVLNVPSVPFGRWRTIHLDPAPPPLVVGEGARDGEPIELDTLLRMRLERPTG